MIALTKETVTEARNGYIIHSNTLRKRVNKKNFIIFHIWNCILDLIWKSFLNASLLGYYVTLRHAAFSSKNTKMSFKVVHSGLQKIADNESLLGIVLVLWQDCLKLMFVNVWLMCLFLIQWHCTVQFK